ncbi:MAG: class I SAM-dependent methyltransferase [Anaerolineae bacterium]
MHERRFTEIERLRSPERLAHLDLDAVLAHTLDGLTAPSVLDVGTGTGIFAEAFARRGLRVEGLDVNAEMLAAARQLVPQVTFREGLAESLPYPAGAFDLVFHGMVFHETDDRLQALKEAARVARQRVALLEWPYEMGEFGPPQEERLRAEEVASLAQEAGLPVPQVIPLTHLVLYRIDAGRQVS